MRDSISTLLLAPLVGALGATPGAIDALCRATGLSPEALGDADARISPAVFRAAWSEAGRLAADPTFSLRVAASVPEGALGVVEYLCRTAPTLGVALGHWARYLRLLNGSVEVGLVTDEREASFRVLSESEAPAPRAHELCFALLVVRARAITPTEVPVVRVAFTHACEDARAFERWFGAPVRFHAERTELVFGRGALDLPLRTADPNLHRIVRAYADERVETGGGEGATYAARTSTLLRAALRSNEASVDEVARRLGLSPKSLQRRLKEEGTSFQELRDDVRKSLAREYLDAGLSIAETSFLLGFSEPSAFFRAFKRWTGRTPLEGRPRGKAAQPAT